MNSEIFRFATLIPLFASAIFSLYRQLQMLQQNSYFPSRYLKWISGSYAPQLAVSSIAYCVLCFCSTAKFYLITFILSLIMLACNVYIAVRTHKTAIKPLVFTKRVLRLYGFAAAFLLLLLIVGVSGNSFFPCEACFLFYLLFSSVASLLCLAAWLLSLPVEKVFNLYYINDAKKILKNSPGLKVVGITGSYGKTTTKFILTRILSERFNTVCTPASFNTPLGVVRTIREEIKPQTEIFVCEMGAKNIGDIKEICDIVNPDFGIITSVGAQHLETFKTVDNVFNTKFELCDSIEKKGGICFGYIESAGIAERMDKKPYCTYVGYSTDYFASNIKTSSKGTSFELHLKDETLRLSTKLLGAHSVSDILIAAATAYEIGVSADDIKVAVSSLKPTEHRLELKSFVNGSLVIDDAYNSNPEGCLEALRVLGCFDKMRKTVITPGLVELGDREYSCNYDLGLACAENADDIILVGKNRSKPMLDAVSTTDFDSSRLTVVSSFKEGLEHYKKYADKKSVLLIENDLPDNYLN